MCQLHSGPDGSRLLVAHPADFVQWMKMRFDMSQTSIRLTYEAATVLRCHNADVE